MNKIRDKVNDDGWYGAPWAEFFISLVISKVIQVVWMPWAWFVVLLPVIWVLTHLLIGSWIKKHATADLFRKE